MKKFVLIFFLPIFLGCSQVVTIPDAVDDIQYPVERDASAHEWEWGSYTVRISEDRMEAEIVPCRTSTLHLNVNPFVEGPLCPNCLTIGNFQPQGDGTFKLTVWLRHPFPGHPEYTGFDVRGIVVFKATDYMKTWNYDIATSPNDLLMVFPLLNFSDPNKGGAAILNPDGYTFYLNPLLEYEDDNWEEPPPILNYSKGKRAIGDSPDSTINAYKLFSDGSSRRMFKTTDYISRTYHIKPPEEPGPFEFGYVVHACWAQPTTTPVTKPETDFPVVANCEDPWSVTIEQLQPIDYGVAGEELFKVTVKHRPLEFITRARILVPSLSDDDCYDPQNHIIEYLTSLDVPDPNKNIVDDETTELILRISAFNMAFVGDGLVSGHHLGILSVHTRGECDGGIGPYESQLLPVDVYVEL